MKKMIKKNLSAAVTKAGQARLKYANLGKVTIALHGSGWRAGLLAIVSFLVFTTIAAGAGTKLEVVDYFSMQFHAADDKYAYGKSSSYVLARMDINGNITSGKDFRDIDPNLTVHRIFTTSTRGLVFVESSNVTTSKRLLFKSVDSGANFGNNPPNFDNGNYVLMLGDVDGTEANQISNVSILRRGFCEDTARGQLLVGEYNVHRPRSPGSTNDQVRLMKSADNGTTWSEVAHWNTDGSHKNIRHIHAVRYDPYSGYIYICTGDLDVNSGIIRWDGTSPLPSNTYPADYEVSLAGAQRYRVCDILFTNDYLYTIADTPSEINERGIWRTDRALTISTRVNSDITAFDMHAGFTGLKTSGGTLIFTEFLARGCTDLQMNVYTSGDDGETWQIVGKYGHRPGSLHLAGLFEWHGHVYMSSGGGAGKGFNSCVVAKPDGPFNEDEPIILHPIYYVAPDGVDTTGDDRGWKPSLPWATPIYALTGDRICNGARVIVAAGEYGSDSVILDWDGNTYPGTGTTVVEGEGQGTTAIYGLQDSATAYLFRVYPEESPVIFKRLSLYTKHGTGHVLHVRENSEVRLADCIVGSPDYDVGRIVTLRGTLSGVRTLFQGVNADHGIVSNVERASLTLHYCIFKGLDAAVYLQEALCNAEIYNCTFYGYDRFGVGTIGKCTVVPTVKNCIFDSAGLGDWALKDTSGLDETDDKIDYNCYYDLLHGIANGGGSHSLIHTVSQPVLFQPNTPIMIGIPVAGIKGFSVTSLLGTNQVAMWDPRVHDYVTVTEDTLVVPGQGYWAQFNQQTEVIIPGTAVSGEFTYDVADGWNIISIPYDAEIGLEPITSAPTLGPFAWTDQGNGYELVAAINGGLNLIHNTLQPWWGYWVLSDGDGTITWSPPVPSPPALELMQIGAAAVAQSGWQIQLTAVAGSRGDLCNYCGVADEQTARALSIPNPPAVSGSVDLYFPTQSGLMATDIRTPHQERLTWEFEVRTDLADTEVIIGYPDLSLVPNDYHLMLTDLDAEKSIYMRTTHSYSYDSGPHGGVRHFQLSAELKSETSLLVTAMTAQQVNSQRVAISYALSQAAQVDIQIRNIAGRLIRRVQSDSLQTVGSHSVTWNLTSRSGSRVPAGTYLCVITARTENGQAASCLRPITVTR